MQKLITPVSLYVSSLSLKVDPTIFQVVESDLQSLHILIVATVCTFLYWPQALQASAVFFSKSSSSSLFFLTK